MLSKYKNGLRTNFKIKKSPVMQHVLILLVTKTTLRSRKQSIYNLGSRVKKINL